MDTKKEAGRVSLDMNARGYESVFSKTLVETIFILWSGGIDDSVLTATNDKGTRHFRLTELGLRAPISSSTPKKQKRAKSSKAKRVAKGGRDFNSTAS